jgi:hypothetical protein
MNGNACSQATDDLVDYVPLLPAVKAKAAAVDPHKGYLVKELKPGIFMITDGAYESAFAATGKGVVLLGVGELKQYIVSPTNRCSYFINGSVSNSVNAREARVIRVRLALRRGGDIRIPASHFKVWPVDPHRKGMSLPIGTLGRCKTDHVPSVRSSIAVNRFEEQDRLLHTIVEDLKIPSSKPGLRDAGPVGHYYWHQDYSCCDDLSCGLRRGRNKAQERQERRHRQKTVFAHEFPFSDL